MFLALQVVAVVKILIDDYIKCKRNIKIKKLKENNKGELKYSILVI